MLANDKFKIIIKEENSLNDLDLEELKKLFDDIYIAKQGHDIIIYDFQAKTKINTLKFHLWNISSIHLCKNPFFVDNNPLIPSNNSFFVLSSSIDGKFAMHNILYENHLFKFELIAQCQPTKDEINGVIQIESGQFIVSTRDQHIILFSKYINNKNFQKIK